MPDITLVRQEDVQLTESEKDLLRRTIFKIIDGHGERGRKQWRRFWNWVLNLEPGEMMDITTRKPRSGPFHRRHMKMEQSLFEQQERFDIFDPVFRDWLKVGAGHVTWCPGPKGGVFPVPLSIDFNTLDDSDMRDFHEKVVTFLRTDHAAKTLWPHLSPTARIEMIEGFLATFGE